MGYRCDGCGTYLDTNISTYEYHLVETGSTKLCSDCREEWTKEGRFVWSWAEGWAKPPRGRLYHYYDGRVWKGGKTHRSSLCKRSEYNKRDLINTRKDLPEDKICKKCLEKYMEW